MKTKQKKQTEWLRLVGKAKIVMYASISASVNVDCWNIILRLLLFLCAFSWQDCIELALFLFFVFYVFKYRCYFSVEHSQVF